MTAPTEAGAGVVVIANRFEFVAVNDTRDFCECCGRKGLKRVVWVRDIENDTVKHFGTTCALAPSKSFGIDREIKAGMRSMDSDIKARWARAHKGYRAAGGKFGAMNTEGAFPVLDRALLDLCFATAGGGA